MHIYFIQTDEYETEFARKLHERVRRECASFPLPSCTWCWTPWRLRCLLTNLLLFS